MPTVQMTYVGARATEERLIASLGAGLTGGTRFTVVEAANDGSTRATSPRARPSRTSA